MSDQQGFVDLRLNHQRDQTAESFWPSFTDVMTVIVMIFLLAMLILLVRNMELVEELRATMEAERRSTELARSRDRERVQLSEQLSAAEAENAGLRGRIGELETARAAQDRVSKQERQHIKALSGRLKEQQQRAEELEHTLGTTHSQLRALEQDQSALQTRHQAAQAELEALTRRARTQQADLRRIEAERQTQQEELKRLEAARRELQSRDAASQEKIDALTAERRTQDDALNQAEDQRKSQAEEVALLQASFDELKTSYAESRDELDSLASARRVEHEELQRLQAEQRATTQEMEGLRAAHESRGTELTTALERLRAVDSSRAELEKDYGELRQRYDRLVRPARSPKGKYVIEVRYAKTGGRPHIRFREAGEKNFRSISRAALESRLAALDRDHPEGLYIKIIFPEDSGLSYNEAWRFTNDLHRKYDDYFRERSFEEADPPPETGDAP
ncbi:MAG: hypothetical protein U9Q81_12600 [Pseudomonadota bacterium]|nr:hypothetical protein [Pseudomonadota bacterium]